MSNAEGWIRFIFWTKKRSRETLLPHTCTRFPRRKNTSEWWKAGFNEDGPQPGGSLWLFGMLETWPFCIEKNGFWRPLTIGNRKVTSLGSYVCFKKEPWNWSLHHMGFEKNQGCLLLSINLCGRYRSQAYLIYKILLIADGSSDHWKFNGRN